MFPLIFQSLCAHTKIFVQHFTRTCLYLERRVWNMSKNMFWRNIYVCSKFSCVCSSHGLCACAHTHSIEGTLPPTNISGLLVKHTCMYTYIKGVFNPNLIRSHYKSLKMHPNQWKTLKIKNRTFNGYVPSLCLDFYRAHFRNIQQWHDAA